MTDTILNIDYLNEDVRIARKQVNAIVQELINKYPQVNWSTQSCMQMYNQFDLLIRPILKPYW